MFKSKSFIVPVIICGLFTTSFADIRSLVVNEQGSVYKPASTKDTVNDFTLMMGAHFLGAGIVSGVGAFKVAKYSKENLVNGVRLGYQGFKQGAGLGTAFKAGSKISKGVVLSGMAASFGIVSLLGLELGGAGLYLYATEKEK